MIRPICRVASLPPLMRGAASLIAIGLITCWAPDSDAGAKWATSIGLRPGLEISEDALNEARSKGQTAVVRFVQEQVNATRLVSIDENVRYLSIMGALRSTPGRWWASFIAALLLVLSYIVEAYLKAMPDKEGTAPQGPHRQIDG